ncbi:MAG: glycosyltransferase family 2 protein [Cyanobacteria bacterium J06650_10]
MLESSSSICILIPIHNRKAITLQCLCGLSKCNLGPKYHIVVIDDGSTDGSAELIQKKYPEVSILQGDGTLWWTGAIKLGMQYAYSLDCDYMIWLNDDCLVQPSTIEQLVEFVAGNQNSIIGGVGYEKTLPTQPSFGGKQKKIFQYRMLMLARREIYSCDLLSGNLVCMPTSVVQDIGYPDPKKCAHYGGDSHFLIRARKAGYSIFVDARWPAQNISTDSTSKMNSNRWLLGDTSAKKLFQLIFTRQSILSWRVWWFLYTEDYGPIGICPFLIKIFKMITILLCISILRPLPLPMRKRISLTKRRLFAEDA